MFWNGGLGRGWVRISAAACNKNLCICTFLCVADDVACNSELDQTDEDDCPMMAGNTNSSSKK